MPKRTARVQDRPSAAVLDAARAARAAMAGSGAGKTATLIVSSSYSNCGFCGGHAFSGEETHDHIAGYGPVTPGCGARFTEITSDRIHMDEALRARLAEMRPDLPVVGFWERTRGDD